MTKLTKEYIFLELTREYISSPHFQMNRLGDLVTILSSSLLNDHETKKEQPSDTNEELLAGQTIYLSDEEIKRIQGLSWTKNEGEI